MSSTLQLSGAQPQKPVRFAPIYTGRWSSGLWTNRSPLRDANTNRLTEKFYGPAGDALIDGSNVEVTHRLTLARRPGNSAYSTGTFTGVNRFQEFRLSDPSTEEIKVMVDQASALYSLFSGTSTSIWTKVSGAGQSYMQPVGNTLYWGDGKSNKKWLQSLTTWSAGKQWNGPTTPFVSTFLIDTNGNIQQLIATVIPITSITVSKGIATISSSETLDSVLTVGLRVTFPEGMANDFLSTKSATITAVSGTTFTVPVGTQADGGPTAESGVTCTVRQGGTPISGGTTPTWATTQLTPTLGQPKQALTFDGTVLWVNRGNPVQNWGLEGPQVAPSPALTAYSVAWAKSTYYSPVSVILDSAGNLHQVKSAGVSGASTPTWATSVGGETSDGNVTWICIDTAAPSGNPTAATPTFSPVAGQYVGSQTVTIASTTPGATIFYTTDGTNPTHTSTFIASGATITVGSSQTVKAIASANNFVDSAVATAVYTIGSVAAAPSFSPGSGAYTTTQSVTLSTTTPSATIYYTTDGSTPTTSSTVYSGAISVSVSTVIQAITAAGGFTTSGVSSAGYTIDAGTPPVTTGGGGGGNAGGGGGGVGPGPDDDPTLIGTGPRRPHIGVI